MKAQRLLRLTLVFLCPAACGDDGGSDVTGSGTDGLPPGTSNGDGDATSDGDDDTTGDGTTAGSTSGGSDGGSTGDGPCMGNDGCSAEEICLPDGTCSSPFGQTYNLRIDEATVMSECIDPDDVITGDCDNPAELYFKLRVDGEVLFEPDFYIDGPTASWSDAPVEVELSETTVVEVELWDQDTDLSGTDDDRLTTFCPRGGGGDCVPFDAGAIRDGVMETWMEGNATWGISVSFEVVE